MSKHTPGPWETDWSSPTIIWVNSPSGVRVAECGSQTSAEAGQNATLIAAAPEMLASLKELHEALTYMFRPDVHPEFSHQRAMKAWADAQKIITKAEGR